MAVGSSRTIFHMAMGKFLVLPPAVDDSSSSMADPLRAEKIPGHLFLLSRSQGRKGETGYQKISAPKA